MELLKCRSIILLIVMVLGVSYITALDASTTQNNTSDVYETVNY